MNLEQIKPKEPTCRQSSICDAIACKRYWWCKHRMGIRLRGEKMKVAASLGRIYHRLQQLGPGHEDAVRAEIRTQQEELMAQEDLDGNLTRQANKLTELYNKAEVMAHVFWDRFPQPDHFLTVGTEINHKVEWNGLILEGTIDKLLDVIGNIWIRDHKSTSRPLSVIFGGIGWSIQARMYRVLAEDYCYKNSMKIDAVKGFILDGIITPGIKQCKTDQKNAKEWNCSVEEAYLRRVKEWYRDYEVKAEFNGKPNTKALDSKGVIFTEPLWAEEFTQKLFEMKIQMEIDPARVDLFPRDISRRTCFQYERQCVYHDLCETDPKQWDSLFETKYRFEENTDEKDDCNSD